MLISLRSTIESCKSELEPYLQLFLIDSDIDTRMPEESDLQVYTSARTIYTQSLPIVILHSLSHIPPPLARLIEKGPLVLIRS